MNALDPSVGTHTFVGSTGDKKRRRSVVDKVVALFFSENAEGRHFPLSLPLAFVRLEYYLLRTVEDEGSR